MSRRSRFSSAQRTLKHLRELGRVCAITEKWNPHVGPHGVRQDLFGFIDVLALDPQRGFIAIQACASGRAEHIRRIADNEDDQITEAVLTWLRCGGHIEVWYWRKLKVKRGGKAQKWMPDVTEITLAHFEDAAESGEEESRG